MAKANKFCSLDGIAGTADRARMATGEIVNQMTVPDVWLIDQFDEFTLPLWKMACSDWEEK